MYIKGLVNTKDQSNAWMCEMMSNGSKEALTVLIITHVTHVKRVERLHYVHNIDTVTVQLGETQHQTGSLYSGSSQGADWPTQLFRQRPVLRLWCRARGTST